jgi:hypothetical protein
MRNNRTLFGWRVTRLLFVLGTMAVITGIVRFVLTPSWSILWLIVGGVLVVALSTRGPSDSEQSGRNRSVLGFRARP